MKSVVADPEFITQCLRIVCRNGSTYRITAYPKNLKMSGQTYVKGYEFTGFESGSSFAPTAIDLKNYVGINGVTEAMLMAGVFDNAKGFHFFTDWRNPVEDEEEIAQTIFGKVKMEDKAYTVEQMVLVDRLNQTVGYSFSSQCPHEFGTQEPKGCGVDAEALRVTGTIDSILNQVTFTDAVLTGDPGYFAWGKMWITSGDNNNIPPKTIKTSDGVDWEIVEPFPYTVNPGDTYMLEPGCLKYLGACVAHGGIEWRLGFDYIPGEDILKTTGQS